MIIKILVIDNSASDRLIFENISGEYRILTAGDGAEGVRILEENDGINLLIIDLSTPNTGGLKMLKSLKENERFRNLRTIILTGHDEPDNEIMGINLGADDYIRKPLKPESLKARIDVHAALLLAEHAPKIQQDEQTLTLDMIFNRAPIGIAISHSCGPESLDETIAKINPAFEQITGRTKEELVRLGWAKITHPDDLKEDMENFGRLKSGEIKSYSIDKRHVRPDGSVVWVHMIVAPIVLSDGKQSGHICLIKDITERKAMEEALRESERSKSVFFSHLPGLAYRCNYDYEWTMQYVSNGCFDLTGYHPESLLNNRDLSYNDLISPEYREPIRKEWEKVLAERQPFKYEYEIITATGEKKWVLENGQGIYNDAGEVEALEGIVLDISDRKAIENTLKYNNEHDQWTGLYNREYLVSLLEKDLRLKKNSKKALIGINLSMVQLLALNYGFQYSQNLIKKVAEALRTHCTGNCILFRPRENRFVFYVFDYKDKKELADFSCDIIDTLKPLLVTEGIGGGIGIFELEHTEKEVDVDLLLRKLLIASERFVNLFEKDFEVCFYNEELEALVNRERDIVEALNVIAADDYTNNDLFLQYQPIMDLKTGLTSGFEALSRLKTKKLGLVPPAEFIPIAEKTKLILPVGEKVIAKAFRFLNRLKECGYEGVYVFVNISVIQLLQPDFAGRMIDLMRRMKVNAKNIGIEITESVFASDLENINKSLEEFKRAGFHIAIDDFGAGYSSLSREKELKVDCIKIDRYFVNKLLNANMSQTITSDIISIAHKLGHCAIAEGVEHNIQLEYLKENNCDKVQGNLIAAPLDEEDAIEFLKKQWQI